MTSKRLSITLAKYAFLAPYMLLFLAFVIAPLVYGFVLSFLQWESMSPLPPKFIGIGNYITAFLHDEYFWRAMKATFIFTILSLPITIVVAMALALGLVSVKKRAGLYRAAVYFPTLVNVAVVGIIWRWFYSTEFGLFNYFLESPLAGFFGLEPLAWLTSVNTAMPSVVLMNLWWHVGAPAIILMAGLFQIPTQYYEAATIDGAGAWHRFWKITIPQLKPVLLFVIIMNIIRSFQVFGQTYILTPTGGPELTTRVIVQYIYETAFESYRMGYASAMSWILFAIIAIVSIIQFRAMRSS